jgi:hypothetical protein
MMLMMLMMLMIGMILLTVLTFGLLLRRQERQNHRNRFNDTQLRATSHRVRSKKLDSIGLRLPVHQDRQMIQYHSAPAAEPFKCLTSKLSLFKAAD